MDHSSREPVLGSGNGDSMVPSSNFDGLSSGIKQSFHGSIHQGICPLRVLLAYGLFLRGAEGRNGRLLFVFFFELGAYHDLTKRLNSIHKA